MHAVTTRLHCLHCSIDGYSLQVTGEDSYIHGSYRLVHYKDIREYVLSYMMYCVQWMLPDWQQVLMGIWYCTVWSMVLCLLQADNER